MAKLGLAWQGGARQGAVWQGKEVTLLSKRDSYSWRGKAWQGEVGQGMARRGMARHGTARYG